MTDRPILQTAADVRAALAGRKTQARAVIKWQGPRGFPHSFADAFVDNPAGVPRLLVPFHHPDEPCEWSECQRHRHYGPYDPGDRLWVREAWRVEHRFNTHSPIPHDSAVQYPADDPLSVWDSRLRPSTQLPRWSSRLTYIVKDVRVQRVQDITEADAVAEGCDAVLALTIKRPNGAHPGNPRECYCDLWDELHGPGAWDRNDWVAAITFDVVARNIDAT